MNLQERARVVMFTSNSLKPTNREQAIGRVYRPGQKRGVVVVDVVAEGTLDEVALKLLDNHRDKSEAYIEAALRREFEKQMRRAK
jgi:SNF2 family DNA or RNA helicase